MKQDRSILGVILCGGRSTRMGKNKALLEFSGKPLLQIVIDHFANQIDDIIISTGEISTPFIQTGLPLVADCAPYIGLGPLSGIFSAMQYAQTQTYFSGVITIAVDTPFFPKDYVSRMLKAASAQNTGYPVIAVSETGFHPTFGFWPLDLRQKLDNHLADGKRSILSFAKQCHAQELVFDSIEPLAFDPFFNINTPDDLIRAQIFLPK